MKAIDYNYVNFLHLTVEGTSYEIGKKIAENLLENSGVTKELEMALQSYPLDKDLLPFYRDIQEVNERYCPGLNDEIHGFAERVGIPVENVYFNKWTYQIAPPRQHGCAHLAALSSVTVDSHVYVGRSYEYPVDLEDRCLLTSRVAGKAAHIGFTLAVFGRLEGMNEHGLCVTMSASGIGKLPKRNSSNRVSFASWVAIRALLENCKDTYEAVQLLLEMPYAHGNNLIITDKSNCAALVELWHDEKTVKRFDSQSREQVIYSTNHYLLEEMKHYNQYYDPNFLANSQERLNAMKTILYAEKGRIAKSTIRELLSLSCPDGVCCCLEYEQGYGTVWSMIFDVTESSVDICFGPPTDNEWINTDLFQPEGTQIYTAKLPIHIRG